jgi:release factor glutamine methyltransferase
LSTATALLTEAERLLAEAEVDDATLDAERLLRHVMGWDRATLITRGAEPVTAADEFRFLALVRERAGHRPLQHLIGVQAFWRHEFEVGPDVLIPRPETELLVEAALEAVRDVGRPLVVDVGTGSGCIALSLAVERPEAQVHAIDVSPAALDVAGRNASRLDVAGRVRFHEGDLLAPVAELHGRIDLVVSNPPYVAEADWPTLSPEVRDHEPRHALLSAEGWAVLYKRLARQSVSALRPGGVLAVEVGHDQAEVVAVGFQAAGLVVTRILSDLQGIPRTIVARRP